MNVNSKLAIALGILLASVLVGAAHAENCRSNVVRSAPDSRFLDNRDGTITDLFSGLMWKKCQEGAEYDSGTGGCAAGDSDELRFSWSEALLRTRDLNRGAIQGGLGHSDWRVPNVKELSMLLETACVNFSINETYFPRVGPAYIVPFWTSTPDAEANDQAITVSFLLAPSIGSSEISRELNLRLVRTP